MRREGQIVAGVEPGQDDDHGREQQINKGDRGDDAKEQGHRRFLPDREPRWVAPLPASWSPRRCINQSAQVLLGVAVVDEDHRQADRKRIEAMAAPNCQLAHFAKSAGRCAAARRAPASHPSGRAPHTSRWRSRRRGAMPASTPGIDSGKVMVKKVRQRPAPRLRAASSNEGSIPWIIPIRERIMNGRASCTMPTTTPKGLYMSGNGSAMRPHFYERVVDQPCVAQQDHETVHADDQVELHGRQNEDHVEVCPAGPLLLGHEDRRADSQGAGRRRAEISQSPIERISALVVERLLKEADEGVQRQIVQAETDDARPPMG